MPVNINQPANKISLTNVSLVRFKKGKKRYELACYKNKLLEYRQGLESDLDNVLQVPTVFLSVSRGATAPREDLIKSFGKDFTMESVIAEILKKGEIQVGAGERRELLERLEREVVEIVQGRLVDPGTKRVYSAGMIRKALERLSVQAGRDAGEKAKDHEKSHGQGQGKGEGLSERMARLDVNGNGTPKRARSKASADADGSGAATPDELSLTDEPSQSQAGKHTSTPPVGKKDQQQQHQPPHLPTWTGVVANRSAKSQALDAMKALIAWQPIPVMRARMRLRITCPTNIAKMVAKSKVPSSTTISAENGAAEDKDGETTSQSQPQLQPQMKGTVRDRILGYVEQIESQDVDGVGEEWEVIGFVEPGAFKGLGEFVAGETRGRGRVEVLEVAVRHED